MHISLPPQLIPDKSSRLFAWNGLAFLTPASWELAQTELSKGLNRIVLEDEAAPRLELDWIIPTSRLNQDKVQKKCHKQARTLTDAAEAIIPIQNIPPEWTAHEYRMKDARSLVIGYRIPKADNEPFAFFRLHFDKFSREAPPVCFRSIATSFTTFPTGVAPWAFYDVSFRLSRDFHLTGTSLQAGRKTLSFEWRFRRLFIWYFSLADIALRTKSLSEWCVDFLNNTRLLPVPIWLTDGDSKITYQRRKRFFFGQFEEIGRLCFQYHAEARLFPELNQIALWVINYRKDTDLLKLADSIQQHPQTHEVEQS